jgi:hypothetical protein
MMGRKPMPDYDYLNENQPKRDSLGLVWNVLTVLVLLTVLCVVLVFLVIFINPASGWNPFPPPTPIPTISLPTATPTALINLEATWTPTITLVPTETPTLTPTDLPADTPLPTETPFAVFTPLPSPTGSQVIGGMPFIVGAGTPVATSSIAFHPDAGCNWLGIAGQVFDLSGAPISGQQVRIQGTLGGTPIDMLSLTGLTDAYGSVGFYEFNLGDKPIVSKGTLSVQLLDQAGIAMSDKVYFDTNDNCQQNLVFVNFKQVR